MNSNEKTIVFRDSSSENSSIRNSIEGLLYLLESVAWSNNPELAYRGIVDSFAKIFSCETVNMYLLTVTGDYLTEQASHGFDDKTFSDEVKMLSLATGRTQWMMETGRPIIMDYSRPHCDDIDPHDAVQAGFRSAVSIPLLANDGVLGLCNLSYRDIPDWSEEDIDYFTVIGRAAGVMLKNTQDAKKNAELQTLVERKRLSSEIHDNLSQMISLLKLEAETALLSCDEDDHAAVSENLGKLVNTSQQALAILREELLYLRDSVDQTEGLMLGIEKCLRRFSERWNVTVHLEVIGIRQPIIVSIQTELQLTRILHEALSNTLRHAMASEVFVVLSGDEKRLVMQISDNGCGFDPDKVSSERLGIRIMKERADSLGGKLIVESGKESGTVVRVEVPRLR